MAFEYYSTFIAVAADCPADHAVVPPAEHRGKPTVAAQEFEMLDGRPFEHKMSEVLSTIWVRRRGGDELSGDEQEALHAEYFSEGRPCFRASPLAKKYGWGFVFDDEGRVALVPSESAAYRAHREDPGLEQLAAMRSSRK